MYSTRNFADGSEAHSGPPRVREFALRIAAPALFIVLFLVTGCASPPVSAVPATRRVWPDPPDPPRIAYVGTISTPAEAGVKKSRFRRVLDRITGADADDRLVKPFGIAVDEHGVLCVTDTATASVTLCDRDQGVWRCWDHAGAVRFVAPVAVARRGGVLFVADASLGKVLAFKDERLLLQITNRMERPSGLAVTSNRIYVADSQRHCVIVYDSNGRYVSEIGKRGAGDGEFNFPTHLAVTGDDRLLVTDAMNGRIQVFDAGGHFVNSIGHAGDGVGCFSRPKGVATDAEGRIYVVDANFDNVQTFNSEGRILLAFGEAGSEPGQFWLPNGIAINARNEIFVADSYNRRIQVFRYVGSP